MSTKNHSDRSRLEGESYRELRVLEEVELTSDLSQRKLARKIGVALGVTNVLCKRLIQGGYVSATHQGTKTLVYLLTPSGLARKIHLTGDYVKRFMNHYRKVKELVRDEMERVGIDDTSHVAIYGTTQLSEFVYLALREIGVKRIDIFDRETVESRFLGEDVLLVESLLAERYVKVIVSDRRDLDGRCIELTSIGVQASQIVRVLDGAKVEVKGLERRCI